MKTKVYSVFGQQLTLRELATVAGLTTAAVNGRLYSGMTPEEIVATPLKSIRGSTVKPGDVFGYLTVLERADRTEKYKHRWRCRCVCGKSDHVVAERCLRIGWSKSCGCRRGEAARAALRANARDLTGLVLENGGRVVGRSNKVYDRQGYNEVLWSCVCGCGAPFTARSCEVTRSRRYCSLACPFVKAARAKSHEKSATTYSVDGQVLTIREMAERAGVSYVAVRARLKRGLTLAEACLPPTERYALHARRMRKVQ